MAETPDGDAFEVVRDVDLSGVTGGSGIQSALPDWAGRIWFVTQSGVVGFVSPGGTVRSARLPAGETIANSFAMDESGGVFVVSTHALYRYDVRNARAVGDLAQDLRPRHPRQGRPGQPGQRHHADADRLGVLARRRLVAITDNADPQMNVVVFRRGKAGPGRTPLCKQPIFPTGQGSDENSLIAVPGGVVAENNYGYVGPRPAPPSTRTADTTPGLVKVAVDYRNGGCHIAWRNTTARIPTVVSKLSLKTGLIYGYTHPAASEIPTTAPVPEALAPDAWFFTAFSARTGKQVWSKYTGSRSRLQQQLRAGQPRPRRHGLRRHAGWAAADRRRSLRSPGVLLDHPFQDPARGLVVLAEGARQPTLHLLEVLETGGR